MLLNCAPELLHLLRVNHLGELLRAEVLLMRLMLIVVDVDDIITEDVRRVGVRDVIQVDLQGTRRYPFLRRLC